MAEHNNNEEAKSAVSVKGTTDQGLVFVVIPSGAGGGGGDSNGRMLAEPSDEMADDQEVQVEETETTTTVVHSYELQIQDEVVPTVIITSPHHPVSHEEANFNNGRNYVKIAPRAASAAVGCGNQVGSLHKQQQQRILLLNTDTKSV